MKNKQNKKSSPNRIKCQISGIERMSNKTYLANKGEKFGVTGNVWASFYLNKQSYKDLVLEVEAGGLEFAANVYKVDKARVIKWLRFNGRGKFVKVGRTQSENAPQQVATVELAPAEELATV